MIIDELLLLLDTIVLCYFISILSMKQEFKYRLFFVTLYFCLVQYRVVFDLSTSDTVTLVLINTLPMVTIVCLICLIYKMSILNSILSTILYSCFIIATQLLSVCIFIVISIIFDLNKNSDIYNYSVQLFYELVLFCILRMHRDKIKFIFNSLTAFFSTKLRVVYKLVKISLVVILVVALILFSVYTVKHNGLTSVKTYSASIFAIIILLLLGSIYYEFVIEKYKQKKDLECKAIDTVHKDFVHSMNSFGHSYNNLIQTISFLVNRDDLTIEDIRPVLNDIVDWNDDNHMSSKLKFINIPSTVVSSVLSLKLEYADTLGVELIVNFNGDNSKINLNSKDFIDILGVLLDNAIEASCMTDKKSVLIDLSFTKSKLVLTIENQFTVDKYGKPLKWGNSKSIGLSSIEDIVSKNKNISFEKFTDDNTFKVVVKILNSLGDDYY